jgi:hypothetical protein
LIFDDWNLEIFKLKLSNWISRNKIEKFYWLLFVGTIVICMDQGWYPIHQVLIWKKYVNNNIGL